MASSFFVGFRDCLFNPGARKNARFSRTARIAPRAVRVPVYRYTGTPVYRYIGNPKLEGPFSALSKLLFTTKGPFWRIVNAPQRLTRFCTAPSLNLAVFPHWNSVKIFFEFDLTKIHCVFLCCLLLPSGLYLRFSLFFEKPLLRFKKNH